VSEVYVYALLGQVPPPGTGAGLCEEPLRVVRVGELVAAVGDMTDPPAVSEATLRAHDAVVRRLADAVDAILPVRSAIVAQHCIHLEAGLLDTIGHLPDWNRAERQVEPMLGDAPAAVETPRDHAGDETLGPGARYLTARRAEWRRAREAPELTPLRPALAPVVRAERVTRHDAPPLLASVYHLIDRGDAAAYHAVVDHADLGTVRVVATGPWPPYAFAPEALG